MPEYAKDVREPAGFRFEAGAESAAPVRSKLTSKAQTVLPRAIRETLRVGPGDWLEYRVTPAGVTLTKAAPAEDDPFASFSEWGGAEDEEAYGRL